MHQQAAAVALLPVPAAEVVRAMFSIKQPLKMHRVNLADGVIHQQFTHFAVVRRIAIVEGDAHGFAGLFNGIKNTQRARLVDGHRFFGDHITARAQGAHDIVIVGSVHGGDDNRIGLRFADHRLKLRRLPGGNGGRALLH